MKGILSLTGIKPGDLYTTNGDDVWRVKFMCEEPTITLENVETKQQIGGAVGCTNVSDFVKLEPGK